MNSEEEIIKFINEYLEKLKHLFKELNYSWWSAYTTGKKEYFEKYEQALNNIKILQNNKEDFEKIKSFLKLEIKDFILKRQIEIMYNDFLVSQGDLNLIKKITSKEIEIEKKFNTFRAEFEGKSLKDNEIKHVLKTETNSEKLKSIWESSKKQGELVSRDVLEVVKLRNELARSLGFENYYIMSLKAAEQDPLEIENIFKELAEKTEEPFRKIKNEIDEFLSKKFDISNDNLKPWHYQDLFFQEGPEIYDINLDKFFNQDILEISKKFYKSIGFDVGGILGRSDLYEKEGKSQHAFMMDLDREGDVRILENIKNDSYWMNTTLHELGHAIYQESINQNLPFLIKDVSHIFVTEAIAMFFARKSKNYNFIKNYSKNFDESEKDISEKLWKTLKLSQLVTCRWMQVMVNFERELYKNPDQDLNKLWWGFVKKFQLIDFHRDKSDWASKLHLASAPVYYQNYMLGELLASQLHHKITKDILKEDSLKNVDYSNNKEVGNYLKKSIFSLGLTYKWDELIERATGEKLTPTYFINEFAK